MMHENAILSAVLLCANVTVVNSSKTSSKSSADEICLISHKSGLGARSAFMELLEIEQKGDEKKLI